MKGKNIFKKSNMFLISWHAWNQFLSSLVYQDFEFATFYVRGFLILTFYCCICT